MQTLPHIVVLVFDLRVLGFGEAVFVNLHGEMRQGVVPVHIIERIMSFECKIRCADDGTGSGEVSAVLAVHLFQYGMAFLGREAG